MVRLVFLTLLASLSVLPTAHAQKPKPDNDMVARSEQEIMAMSEQELRALVDMLANCQDKSTAGVAVCKSARFKYQAEYKSGRSIDDVVDYSGELMDLIPQLVAIKMPTTDIRKSLADIDTRLQAMIRRSFAAKGK